ncbi:MAG TPA: TldD/PmbA family protein, partial [Burkholderiaceae bacterium]|nr:TldD/PmbA family protein [Burkholderiaceae bacterium]
MIDKLEATARRAAQSLPTGVQHWAVRGVSETSEQLCVRHGVAQAPERLRDEGVMVTVIDGGGLGYAGTCDTSESGLREAFARAHELARASAGKTVFDYAQAPRAQSSGRYESEVRRPAHSMTLADKFELLRRVDAHAHRGAHIVDSSTKLWTVQTEQLFFTSEGAMAHQRFSFTTPEVQVTAHRDGVTQVRSSAGQYNGFCQQGGLEVLDRARFEQEGERVAAQALELVSAPVCPSQRMDLVLMPDQMMLQIHESIGHPLELDRILGDERNFAGTSFVTLDMFGSYRYGSELLNVTYDPTRREELASFAYDDDGTPAERQFIIERGLLKRPLGGSISLARAREMHTGLEGVATSRACSWNRAPIDRMSNLNVEPGTSSLADMIASTEYGVLMRTNCSWSIDDSRNKFQFGCEWGELIENGEVKGVVKNPNYRGISAEFWRSLKMVGDRDSFEVHGTLYCGKGEPNQVI